MSKPSKEYGASTRGIHAGRRPQAGDAAVVTPIYQTATFVPTAEDYALVQQGREHESQFYSRYGNPTVVAVERKIAELESAEASRLFASGNAAMHAALMALTLPGGHVVATDKLYGGTRGLLDRCLVAAGGSVTYVDIQDEVAVRAALSQATRVLLCESLANPTLEVADIPHLAALAHEHGAHLVVDATFASPILQRPLELGADISMHSATKYLSGHSDVIAGVVSGSKELLRRVTDWRISAGGCLDPHSAFLLDRGLKTLAMRMQAHCRGALALAEFLAQHPRVRQLCYPGLASSTQHERAKRLLGGEVGFEGSGGMLLVSLDGDDEVAARVMQRLEIALAAPSLGGVETLVSQPAKTSHAAFSEAERRAVGIPPGSIRVSVGVEDPEDLIADFERALASA